MKLIRALKNNVFSMRSLFSKHNKKDDTEQNLEKNDKLPIDDKLFFLLNIGNHEYSKNKPYIIDEIEFRLDQNESTAEIAHFISSFIKKTYSIKINVFELENWIKTTYKQKIEARKSNEHRNY